MQLTKQQAIEQGYKMCGFDNDGWQSLQSISDFDFNNIRGSKVLIASKDAIHPSIGEDELRDLLIDYITDNWVSQSGDDDPEEIAAIINKFSFDGLTDRLNEQLNSKSAFMLTDIELVNG